MPPDEMNSLFTFLGANSAIDVIGFCLLSQSAPEITTKQRKTHKPLRTSLIYQTKVLALFDNQDS